MNHKLLFWISLLVIAVGVTGLILNKNTPPDNNEKSVLGLGVPEEKNILVAVTTRPVALGRLLSQDDFQVKTITVPADSDLVNYDVSAFKSLTGHLLTANMEGNSYISPQLIETPDSPTFLRNSLQAGEIAWKFEVDQANAWLLDSIQVGDQVALYLRTLETNKNKKLKDTVALDAKELSSGKNQQYVLTAILDGMTVLRVNRYEEKEGDQVENHGKGNPDGYIHLRMRSKDIKKIHVIALAGDLLLVPAVGGAKQLEMDQILPNLPKFKELRG